MRDKPDHKVLDAYGKHFAPPYLFVMLMRPVVNEAELQYVLGHICRTQPQVIGCASESRYLYLLIAGMDSETARVMIHQHLRAVALQTDYYVSFSDVFYDIRTLPQHKLQATLTQTVNTALGPQRARLLLCGKLRGYYWLLLDRALWEDCGFAVCAAEAGKAGRAGGEGLYSNALMLSRQLHASVPNVTRAQPAPQYSPQPAGTHQQHYRAEPGGL